MRFNRLFVAVSKSYADCQCFHVSRKSCCSNREVGIGFRQTSMFT